MASLRARRRPAGRPTPRTHHARRGSAAMSNDKKRQDHKIQVWQGENFATLLLKDTLKDKSASATFASGSWKHSKETSDYNPAQVITFTANFNTADGNTEFH